MMQSAPVLAVGAMVGGDYVFSDFGVKLVELCSIDNNSLEA